MLGVDLLGRVGLATLLGVAIGVERQWRSRMAGLQTMALVSMGSALFLILGAFAFQTEGNDRLRVGAQIVTGIGFLGAGVIMKQGSSVTGLNTAATLWATAAVGALAGAWMWREALTGAGIIIVGNSVLHPLAVRMDRMHSPSGRELPPADYVFELVCASAVATRMRVLLLDTLGGLDLKAVRSLPTGASDETAIRAEFSTPQRDDARLEKAVRALAADPDIRSVRWASADDAAAGWT